VHPVYLQRSQLQSWEKAPSLAVVTRGTDFKMFSGGLEAEQMAVAWFVTKASARKYPKIV
jgi:hypothetical protein